MDSPQTCLVSAEMTTSKNLIQEEDRGAGGKQLRSRPHSGIPYKTPYDRPLTGRHAALPNRNPSFDSFTFRDQGATSRSWFSKLASGAGNLLASVFRRQEEEEDSESLSSDSGYSSEEEDGNSADTVQVTKSLYQTDACKDLTIHETSACKELTVHETNACKEIGEPVSIQKNSSTKLAEIEEVLANKTFTWDEFIYLTELLQSRLVDRSPLKEPGSVGRTGSYGKVYARHAAVEEARRWSEERRQASEGFSGSTLHTRFCNNAPNLILSSDRLDILTSSPVDIAKAYMGVRPAWASSPISFQTDLPGSGSKQPQLTQSLPAVSNDTTSVLQNSVHEAENSQYGSQILKRQSPETENNLESFGTFRRIRQKASEDNVEEPISSQVKDDPATFCLPFGSDQATGKVTEHPKEKVPSFEDTVIPGGTARDGSLKESVPIVKNVLNDKSLLLVSSAASLKNLSSENGGDDLTSHQAATLQPYAGKQLTEDAKEGKMQSIAKHNNAEDDNVKLCGVQSSEMNASQSGLDVTKKTSTFGLEYKRKASVSTECAVTGAAVPRVEAAAIPISDYSRDNNDAGLSRSERSTPGEVVFHRGSRDNNDAALSMPESTPAEVLLQGTSLKTDFVNGEDIQRCNSADRLTVASEVYLKETEGIEPHKRSTTILDSENSFLANTEKTEKTAENIQEIAHDDAKLTYVKKLPKKKKVKRHAKSPPKSNMSTEKSPVSNVRDNGRRITRARRQMK